MPQMAPYNWLMLMLIFNLIMYTLNCYTHFLSPPTNNPFNNNKSIKYKWQW